ncbi:hypothetical protein LCGC14_0372490 [marine sediment metagenome]|uniref:Uncharacterized protein n=1 Tax=marine sediment metagenome TaxID=412755 RepID=A0A0F9WDB4_9ZZZZ
MNDSNIVIFLDKIKKNLEMNKVPQTIADIDTLLILLQRDLLKKKGKQIIPITIPPTTETEKANPIFLREFELANKLNEIIFFLNERFPVS